MWGARRKGVLQKNGPTAVDPDCTHGLRRVSGQDRLLGARRRPTAANAINPSPSSINVCGSGVAFGTPPPLHVPEQVKSYEVTGVWNRTPSGSNVTEVPQLPVRIKSNVSELPACMPPLAPPEQLFPPH